GLRYLLGCTPPPPRQQPAIQGSAIPIGPSSGVCDLHAAWSGRRPGFRDLYETSLGHAGALPKLSEQDTLVSTSRGRALSGVDGMVVPQVLGVGYGYVGDALNGTMTLKLMLVLVVLKLLAVTTSYASGNAGGIFGPALFIGAMLGGSVGTFAHNLFPSHTATAGAYALVGMGTAFAGIVRAPMTSVVMIFE